MISLTPVIVHAGEDEYGQVIPKEIVWRNHSVYKITRILHTCCPEDYVMRYTVLIGKSQLYLFFDGKDWSISASIA